jgi:hypothetical protein
MSNWHTSTCLSPDVFVNESNNPTCHACGQCCPPEAELLALLQGGAQSNLSIPPDEPRDRMNLRWPKDVPYFNPTGSAPKARAGALEPPERPALDRTRIVEPNQAIYGDTLRHNEFRLVCLEAVPRRDYPVHLTLETYTHDNRPEYETVSYQWAGENGDSTQCRPIFIGPYWHVILQTQNCWSMLRFVRPRRGIRLMWVDAICMSI